MNNIVLDNSFFVCSVLFLTILGLYYFLSSNILNNVKNNIADKTTFGAKNITIGVLENINTNSKEIVKTFLPDTPDILIDETMKKVVWVVIRNFGENLEKNENQEKEEYITLQYYLGLTLVFVLVGLVVLAITFWKSMRSIKMFFYALLSVIIFFSLEAFILWKITNDDMNKLINPIEISNKIKNEIKNAL